MKEFRINRYWGRRGFFLDISKKAVIVGINGKKKTISLSIFYGKAGKNFLRWAKKQHTPWKVYIYFPFRLSITENCS